MGSHEELFDTLNALYIPFSHIDIDIIRLIHFFIFLHKSYIVYMGWDLSGGGVRILVQGGQN